MNRSEPNEPTQEPTDAELAQWLAQWPPPALPARLDAAVGAAYRRAFPPRPWWWRWLTASLRVPVPVAAAAGILLCAALWLAARPAVNLAPVPSVAGLPPTRFVEVPIERERLVTRVVYVRAKPVPEKRSRQPASALPTTTKTKQADLAGFRPVSEIRLEVSPGGQEP